MERYGKYAKLEDGRVIPIEVDEIEWILRHGDEEEILRNRLYIASIVSAYRNHFLLKLKEMKNVLR